MGPSVIRTEADCSDRLGSPSIVQYHLQGHNIIVSFVDNTEDCTHVGGDGRKGCLYAYKENKKWIRRVFRQERVSSH